jgi:predicted nucleotidyltransferase
MALIADPDRDQVVSSLRRLTPRLRAHGISSLAIFGSRARGDHRPDSDLDVLVDVAPGIKFSLLDLVGISHLISDELGIPANMFMRRSLEPQMRLSIEPDLVEVFQPEMVSCRNNGGATSP